MRVLRGKNHSQRAASGAAIIGAATMQVRQPGECGSQVSAGNQRKAAKIVSPQPS